MSTAPHQDNIEAFRLDLASLRDRVGTGPRPPVEEDLQLLSNRRYHLVLEYVREKARIEAIVADHHRLSPQLRLRVLGTC